MNVIKRDAKKIIARTMTTWVVPITFFNFLFCWVSCVNHELTPPVIISNVDPKNGPKGTEITITGTFFSNVASDNIVKINGKPAIVKSATTTQLKVEVAPGSGTGYVTVMLRGQTAVGPLFTYELTTTVSTLAGSTQGYADGPAMSAQFGLPRGLTIDAEGNLYVADVLNNRIRKVAPDGDVTTIAGSTAGQENGTGLAAKFNSPLDVTADDAGNLYVADKNNFCIRKITPEKEVSTFAGQGTYGFVNGPAAVAQFGVVTSLAMDKNNNLYLTEFENNCIRRISSSGMVTTLAGGNQGAADGQGSAAGFYFPFGIDVDARGNVYVADTFNHLIRKITPDGLVTTLAGKAGEAAIVDGRGADARFHFPSAITVDAAGNLFVTEIEGSNVIRRITPQGVVSTIAGVAGTSGMQDGDAKIAQFSSPYGIVVDTDGTLYVADAVNRRIRKIVRD